VTESKEINSWGEFETLATGAGWSRPSRIAHFFRGEADASYRLQPSLLRRVPEALEKQPLETVRQTILETEKYLTKQFMSEAELHANRVEISETQDMVAWWAVMQHYGAPTRLLDWTRSPHVALYFAVHDKFDKPGAIWVLDFPKLYSLMQKSSQKDLGEMSIEERRAFFDEKKEQSIIFVYERTRKSSRMIAQQHALSVSTDVLTDYSQKLTSTPEGPLATKYLIPADMKKSFFYRLWRTNLTANSLFPGLEGLGRHIGEIADLEFAVAAGQIRTA
jgi:FRG domain